MRPYAPKVTIETSTGDVLLHIPGEAARLMVAAGNAHPRPGSGRIKTVVIERPASSHAQMIGPPSPAHIGGVKFTRTVALAGGGRIYEHHPRSFW